MEQNSTEEKKNFYVCKHCGKRLIERLPNGVWKFCYGRNPKYSSSPFPPVEIYIFGSLKMRCISSKCGKMNTFNFFPGEMKTFGEDVKQSLREQYLGSKTPEEIKVNND